MEEHVALKKKAWGNSKGVWVPHDTRDEIVDYVKHWSESTEIGQPFARLAGCLASKFHHWKHATARPTSTTAKFPAISGWRPGRSRRSSTTTEPSRWKATGG